MKNILLLIFFVGISIPLLAQIAIPRNLIQIAGAAGTDQTICSDCNNSTQLGNSSNQYCSYEWSDGTNIISNDAMPFVCPAVTTTYIVIFTDNDGNAYYDQVTVTVSNLTNRLYRPDVMKKIGGNQVGGTLIQDNYKGAMTFVNLDNDDNDNQFDNSDNEVSGGDNELIKWEIETSPVAVDQSIVYIKDSLGSNNIRIWMSPDKTLGTQYKLGDPINLTQNNNKYQDTVWIEGIKPHYNSEKTILKVEVREQGAFSNIICDDWVAVTILGIENISFKGIKNGFSKVTYPTHTSNTLDTADFNFNEYASTNIGYFPELKSYRVFPGSRYRTDTVREQKDKIKIQVKLTREPIEPINVFLRSFDIDDPFTDPPTSPVIPERFIDPNDFGRDGVYSGAAAYKNSSIGLEEYSLDEDNRGVSCLTVNSITVCNKRGFFLDNQGHIISNTDGIVEITCSTTISEVNFLISKNPGDNYRMVANGDRDFITNLRNRDQLDGLAIVAPSVGNGNLGQVKDENGTFHHYMSDILTVWRLLHIESDVMYSPTFENNSEEIIIVDFTGTAQSATEIKTLEPVQGEDNSIIFNDNFTVYPADTAGKGRFENGEIRIEALNPANGFIQICNKGSVMGNSSKLIRTHFGHSINLIGGGLILKYELTNALNTQTIIGTIQQLVKNGNGTFNFGLSLPPGVTNLSNFNGGLLKIGGDDVGIDVNTLAGNSNTLTSNHLRIKAFIDDDDLHEQLKPGTADPYYDENEKINLTIARDVYKEAYLYLEELDDVKLNEAICNKVELKHNWIPGFGGALSTARATRNLGSLNFWVIHLNKSWQSKVHQDRDCNNERYHFYQQAGVALSNSGNHIIYPGGVSCFVFTESIRDRYHPVLVNRDTQIGITTAHEIGHLLGLGHGNNDNGGTVIPEHTMNRMGIMQSGTSLITPPKLINRYINFIRCRIYQPGTGL